MLAGETTVFYLIELVIYECTYDNLLMTTYLVTARLMIKNETGTTNLLS